MKEFKLRNNQVLKIESDSTCLNPRVDHDNLSKMICFHRRYDLGDKHNIKTSDYANMEDLIKRNSKKGDVVVPLYLYDHSGLTISTKPFHCPWDSMQVGFMIVTKETIQKEYGRSTKKNLDKVMKMIESEVQVYDQYLRGDVYQFTLEDSDGHIIDSCGGFFGSDIQENGILEHLDEEVKEEVLQQAA